MEFQLSYFKSWKMMLWKCCTQYASKFGKLSSGHRTGKDELSFQSQRNAQSQSNAKECMNYHKIALISHSSKVMLKIFQGRLQSYMNYELPHVQAGFRKGRGARNKLPTSVGSSKKQERSRKASNSDSLTTPKSSTVWITMNCGKFLKRWEGQTTLRAFWETCMQVKKQQIDLNMEWLVQNGERSMSRLYIITLLI